MTTNEHPTRSYHRERRHRYLLEAIRQHMQEHSQSPTNAQLARTLGIAAPTASTYVRELELRGWISVERGSNWREITVNLSEVQS